LPTLAEIQVLGWSAFGQLHEDSVANAFGRQQSALIGFLPSAILGGWGQPPLNRGQVPPNIDWDTRLMYKFNNPNRQSFPSAQEPYSSRQLIGPTTYVQFLMDHGRDVTVNGQHVPLSQFSADCTYHNEATDGGTFSFPPREQPMHAARRALIAGLAVIRDLNSVNPSPDQRDWVAIVTFDKANPGPVIVKNLSSDYYGAMQECTKLQAVGDRGASTATESGQIEAQSILEPISQGGQGREFSDKVIVLVTDGIPNVTSSASASIDAYMAANPDANFYGGGYYWLDGPVMQAKRAYDGKGYKTYPVGLGLGTDYNFMDRVARAGGTADDNGLSPRGTGNPAEYEARLKQIFQNIISNAGVRLVQ
jgi:hypothetical protein